MINKGEFKILLVDDQIDVVRDKLSLLKMEGYDAIGAYSGEEAIEIVKREKIDILIVDYFMPGLTGEETIHKIKEFNKEIVILLQTGYAGEKPPLDMLEALDIQGYHDKNEGPDKFLLWVAACARSSNQIKENKRFFEEIQLANKTIESIKENQEMLIEQGRLAFLGQIIGGISHNLRTAIMSVSGGIEAIKELAKEYDESIDNENVTKKDHHEIAKEMTDWTEKLRKHCSYMSDVINVVKEQASNLSANSDNTFKIGEMINRIELLMKYEFNNAHCKLNMEIDIDEDIEVRGEINNLIQVITNLILNAIQSYEQKGGNINFKISKKENSIEFIIEDYGKGIPSNFKDKIFKEMVTTKGKNGSGLGIYISHAAIKGNFGGDMWFESEEGKGTKFYIKIPCS